MSVVLRERRDHVEIVTINRPEARNAISMEMREALVRHFADFEMDPSVRCVVMRGAGEIFLAGGDIKAMHKVNHTMTPDERYKLRLDEDEARRNSPWFFERDEKELLVAVGKKELPELQRQSREYAAKFGHRFLPLPGHDHFTILEEFASPTGALTGAVRGLADRL